MVIDLPSTFDGSLTDTLAATATPEQVLLSYLSQLGDPISAAQFDQDNAAYLEPGSSDSTVVTGDVDQIDDAHADVYFSVDGPGYIVAGQPTATVTDYDQNGNPYQAQAQAYNILDANGDISQDAISGIQELDEYGVTLTQAQFSQFEKISGGGTITAATGGTFSLAAGNIDPDADFSGLVATDWSGTTLIGNNDDYQSLTASQYGNDTLTAGDGVGDQLIAGEGIDTLTGGTGGDTFIADSGLAPGSSIQGSGSGNLLRASGDISGATISGVQTLELDGAVTLNATELNGFSAIIGDDLITAATGGTYDLSSLSTSFMVLIAGTNDGTTLIGSESSANYLVASASGTDQLEAGDADGNELFAGTYGVIDPPTQDDGTALAAPPSSANDTLSVGNGNSNHIYALYTTGNDSIAVGNGNYNSVEIDYSAGDNVINIGAGSYNIVTATGSDGDNYIYAHGSDNDLSASSSFGDNIIKVGDGDSNSLDVLGSTGDNSLIAGNGDDDELSAFGATGDNTIQAGNGTGDVLTAGNGDDTLIGGSGGDTFYLWLGNDTVQANGGNNTFIVYGGVGSTDIINNYHTDSGQSVLELSSYSSTEADIVRSGDDLDLSINGFFSIIVQNYFISSDYQLSIQFLDTTWTSQYILSQLSPPAPVDPSQLTGLDVPVVATVTANQTDYQSYDSTGALLGSELVASSPEEMVTQYLDSTGAQYAATIEQNLGGGSTELQDFNGSWNQKDASITYDLGGGSTLYETFDGSWNHIGAIYTRVENGTTIIQDFDGAWNQISASIVSQDAGGITVTQNFDADWNQTSAVRVLDNGSGAVETQYFDGSWNQTSATLVQNLGSGTVETQDFDANWMQTGATIVQHPDANTTITQFFDASWDQLSADIVTVSGNVATDQQFDGQWNLTGGTVTTALTSNTDLVETYDAHWNLEGADDQVYVYGQPGPDVFTSPAGVPTTYVLQPGDVNGDTFTGFITAAADPSSHDVLDFVGYGPTAALTQIDASHWEITAQGHAMEIFTLAATLVPSAGDVVFQ